MLKWMTIGLNMPDIKQILSHQTFQFNLNEGENKKYRCILNLLIISFTENQLSLSLYDKKRFKKKQQNVFPAFVPSYF